MNVTAPSSIDQRSTIADYPAGLDGGAATPPATSLSNDETTASSRSPRIQTLLELAASVAWGLAGIAVFVAVWGIVSTRVTNLPGPVVVFDELRVQLSQPFHDGGPNDKGIGLELITSLRQVISGFVLATVIGVPFGLLIGSSRRAWRAANPVIQMLRPVSPLAWYPIGLVIFGSAPPASRWVITLTALWPIIMNTAAGAAAIPIDQRNVSRVFRFGRLTYARHVVVPNALPSIITGMRLSMGTAWMVIVAVEMMSGKAGIGFFVWDQYNAYNYSRVIVAALLIGVVGFALDLCFLRLGKKVALEESRS
jgi:nitrate/nitrite transport system permease protein